MKFVQVLVAAVGLLSPSVLMAQVPTELQGSYTGTASLDSYIGEFPQFQKCNVYLDVYANGNSNITLITEEATLTGSGEAGLGAGGNLFVKYTVQGYPMSGRLAIKGGGGKAKLSGTIPIQFGGYIGLIEASKVKLKQGPLPSAW